jgi:AcrR family transcriptional regulator
MRKGAFTRERILDTAIGLAAREGLNGLSLSELAGALGVSKSGLFAHFGSKEELQIETLRAGAARFTERVIRPAFAKPRGLPRVRALFEGWLRWSTGPDVPGGCLFMAAAAELDDREGPVRDYLVETQSELLSALARSARIAIEEGHLRRDLDCEQFAFELYGILLVHSHAARLLRDPKSTRRSRAAFDRLVQASSALS